MMKMTLIENKDITLILPTLNEDKNIKDVLDIVNNLYPGISVIVADDGSADKTQDIVMDYRNGDVTLLDRSSEKEKGLTGSVLDAVRLVTTKYIIIMDADLQHPPEKIKQIAELLKHYDMVIGVREKVENSWPLHRKIISWGGDALARMRLVVKPFTCLDTMSGFFGIRTSLFKDVIQKHEKKYEKKGYKIMFETLKYIPKNTRIGYVNYVFGSRKRGESKIGGKHMVYHVKSVMK